MQLIRRSIFIGLALCLLAGRAPAAEWRVAFQVIPDRADAVYTKEAAQAAAVISELGPPLLSAVGFDPNSFDAEVVAGGYEGRMSPSAVLDIETDAAGAGRLASACGIVFDQQSVLEWREADGAPDLAVEVAFQSLTPTLADFFFRTAIGVDRGLAGGFTARDNALLFINLRGADGRPASGLADERFEAALRTAAKVFGTTITGVRPLHVEAHLVAKDGYAAAVGAAAVPELDKLRVRRAALIAAPR
ncbi:MAG: hypothetical protein JO128_10700 [Alphaproteobacteria bacterium]|nr:hypothetical protein [Alphaproteobacteria bacterium]